MSFREDVKSIFRELSPILAGFKLAVIVISYIGIGSVAKWILFYWYPFTRWVWAQATLSLGLPELPIPVKDSLTALIFFLPLGTIALANRIRPQPDSSSGIYRALSLLLGLAFLYFVCKDAFTEIMRSVAENSSQRQAHSRVDVIVRYLDSEVLGISLKDLLIAIPVGLFTIFSVVLLIPERWSIQKTTAIQKLRRASLNSGLRVILMIIFSLFQILYLFLSIGLLRYNNIFTTPVIFSILILLVSLLCIILAVSYAPKKLFISMGAAVAFIFAALLFEIFLLMLGFIESKGPALAEHAGERRT